jgi:GNAT superfamily N-acetyltransferase
VAGPPENLWRRAGLAGFPWGMQFEQFDVMDPGNIRAWYETFMAAKAVDEPLGPPTSLRAFTGWFTEGGEYVRREGWFVQGERGDRDGAYVLDLRTKDNTHRAKVDLLVPLERRRRGIGTALAGHAIERARANGRTMLRGGAMEGSPGVAFAAAMGARQDMTEVRRVQDLDDVPQRRLAELRAKAEAAARGYSLVSWTGATPDEHVDQVAVVTMALEDAPHTAGHEPVHIDAARVRKDEERIAVQGLRYYSVAARCDETGELAGITQVGVDPEQPDWGYQELTAVTRPHRGHRLGLLIKVAMLEWLAEAEPGVRHIMTGNAFANRHMISINEELGYHVLDQWQVWQMDIGQRDEVAVPVASAATLT